MYRYLILLSLVLVVRCQICCIPQQWEGNQGSLTAYTSSTVEPNIVTRSINVSYDSTNGRMATFDYVRTSDGKSATVGRIMDFRSGIQYTADEYGCVKTRLSGSFGDQTCIPADAQLVRTGRVGVGATALNVSTYTFMRGGLQVSETVTTAGCIPVSEGVYGQLGDTYVMQLLGFTGITPGINNPAVFTPPVSCSGGQIYNVNVPAGMRRNSLGGGVSYILP